MSDGNTLGERDLTNLLKLTAGPEISSTHAGSKVRELVRARKSSPG
ncbi:MAG TPA: hypothetical protein VMW30_02715 [Candidatus Paceibacterota bacterium]|nr:hypothetical protein [Candidatus Paceibacterota bacterium]